MEVQFKKHVRIVCDLNVGDKCMLDGWGSKFDGKELVIQDIKHSQHCNSGFLVKVIGYENYIDSDWIIGIEAVKPQPYFGWCDVDGCESEGCSGGDAWRDTGYWIVCPAHSNMYRAGGLRPSMKQSAIAREKSRGADGMLP